MRQTLKKTVQNIEEIFADQQKNDEKTENKDRFFVPGITGRFREQIEKRKLLWQKKEPETVQPQLMGAPSMLPSGSRITKVWEATTFAQDTDGKREGEREEEVFKFFFKSVYFSIYFKKTSKPT